MSFVAGIKVAKWFKITDKNETNTAAVTDDECLKTHVCNTGPDSALPTKCPVGSKKLRFDFDDPNQTIGSSYSTIYSRSGSGVVHGFTLDFDSENVRVKFTVDSDVIFELVLGDIDDIQGAGADDAGSLGGIAGMLKSGDSDTLSVKFDCPIPYDSSMSIEAQKSSGGNKDLDRYLIVLTKET